MNPLLSIITATYNSENTLDKTIKSVLHQDYTNFEYIIVDGKSKDNTLDIIMKYESLFKEKNISYSWISEDDTGIYNAWNKGLKLANGDWIAYLGSDDIYTHNALDKYINAILQNKNADLIHSKVKIFDNTDFIREINKRWNWRQFKKSMNIAHAGAFHNVNYFKKHGAFDENYKIAGDYEMLLRSKHELKTIFIDEFTVIMQEGGISGKLFLRAFKEAEQAKVKTAGISLITAKRYSLIILLRYFGGLLLRKLKHR